MMRNAAGTARPAQERRRSDPVLPHDRGRAHLVLEQVEGVAPDEVGRADPLQAVGADRLGVHVPGRVDHLEVQAPGAAGAARPARSAAAPRSDARAPLLRLGATVDRPLPSRSGNYPVTGRRPAAAGWRASDAREGVAGVHVAGGAAGGEPLLALRRRPVGPGLLVDPALGLLLDPVVADRRGRVLGLLHLGVPDRDVARRRRRACSTRRRSSRPAAPARPTAGSACSGWACWARPDLALGAEQRLQVVPGLVGQDVRLRVAALGAELLLQLVEEADVDVDALVRRAVERARPADDAWPQPVFTAWVKKVSPGCVYVSPAPGELVGPDLVDLVVDLDQVAVVVLVDGARRCCSGSPGRSRRRPAPGPGRPGGPAGRCRCRCRRPAPLTSTKTIRPTMPSPPPPMATGPPIAARRAGRTRRTTSTFWSSNLMPTVGHLSAS